MNTPHDSPSERAYAVKLHATDPRLPDRIKGRLEHVLSGRRHDFDDGPALLACLAHELLRMDMAIPPRDPAIDLRRPDPPNPHQKARP